MNMILSSLGNPKFASIFNLNFKDNHYENAYKKRILTHIIKFNQSFAICNVYCIIASVILNLL